MTTGFLGGDSAKDRGATLNPVANMISMSAGDGLIAVVQVEAVFRICGEDGFRKWSWKAFSIMFLIGTIQNIIVSIVLRKRLVGYRLSWAPMIPIMGHAMAQNQEPWVIQPFILYSILVKWHDEILGIKQSI